MENRTNSPANFETLFFSWKTVEGLGLFLTAVALVCVALFLLI